MIATLLVLGNSKTVNIGPTQLLPSAEGLTVIATIIINHLIKETITADAVNQTTLGRILSLNRDEGRATASEETHGTVTADARELLDRGGAD